MRLSSFLRIFLPLLVVSILFGAPANLQVDTKTHVVTATDGSTIIDAKGITLTVGGFTIYDGAGVKTVVTGSTSGAMFGASGNKIGFLGATPIVRPIGTTDLRQALINFGLYTTGGATPLNLNGGAFTSGTISGSNETLSGTLGVTGNTTLGGTVGITGATTGSSLSLSGNETIGGALTVTGATNGSSLTLSGNASVGGTFGVTGASALHAITGTNETLSGTLGVTGAFTGSSGAFSGLLSSPNVSFTGGTLSGITSFAGGSLSLTGNGTIGGTLGVTGNTTFGGTVGITGATTASSLALSGNETVGGTLGITGATSGAGFSFTGNGTIGGTFAVTGATTASSLSLSGNETVNGTLNVTGATSGSSFTYSGNGSVGGTLTVTGATTTGPLSPSRIGRAIYHASTISGVTLDSNVLTGGGTNATGNTSTLNATLDAIAAAGGGMLVLDGAVLINGPLAPGNNTTIYAPTASCGVYLADGSNSEMLRNKLFAVSGNRLPPNRPGTYNNNIRIVGGTWNGNYDHQSSAQGGVISNFFTCGFFFCGVNDLTLDSVTILNPRVFAALLAYLGNPTVKNCTVKQDTFHTSVSNDGFHYWGPITGVNTIRDVHGVNMGDDFIALSYAEAPGYTGDTHLFDVDPAGVNTIVDGATCENCVGPVVIHGVTWNGFESIITSLGNITIRNVTSSFNSTPATAFTLYADGRWDRLVCDNWKIKYAATVTGAGVDRNVKILPYNTAAITEFNHWQVSGATDDPYDFILFGGNSANHSVTLSDFHVIKTTGGAAAGALFGMSSGSDSSAPGVDMLTVRDCEVSGFAGLIFNGRPVGKLVSVHADNNTLNGAALFSPGAQAPTSLTNGQFALDYLTGKPVSPLIMGLQTDVHAASVNSTAQWFELQSLNFAALYGQLWRLNVSGAGNVTQTRFSINAGNNSSGSFNAQSDVMSFFTGGGAIVGASTTDPGQGVILADAGFRPPHLTDSAAHNDTFFYSTTNGKPAYKDSGGTVAPLVTTSIFATVYNSTAESIPNTTWTILTFDTEGSDTSAIHSTSSNTGRLTCPVTGRYLVEGGASFAANSTGSRALGISLNGAAGASFVKLDSKNAVIGNETQFSLSRVLDMTAGDYVTLQAYQDAGGALNVVKADYYSAQFTMTKLP